MHRGGGDRLREVLAVDVHRARDEGGAGGEREVDRVDGVVDRLKKAANLAREIAEVLASKALFASVLAILMGAVTLIINQAFSPSISSALAHTALNTAERPRRMGDTGPVPPAPIMPSQSSKTRLSSGSWSQFCQALE